MPAKPPLPTRSKSVARRLRVTMTDAERALWYRLRGGRLAGLKFRRQHPVPPYVVDFYCDDARLVIELDGSQHGDAVDHARTAVLERRGMTTLRFWDNDVLTSMDAVLTEIVHVARDRTIIRRYTQPKTAPSAPSPDGRGDKDRDINT